MEPEERKAIGRRIVEVRRQCGLTQRELAGRLGVTQRSVQNYEAGAVVPYKHLRRIEFLGRKRPGWILEGGTETPRLLDVVTALQATMERHQKLMADHVQEMRFHRDRLQQQREVREERLRSFAPD